MQKIKLPDRRILVIIVVAVVAALALMGYLLPRQRERRPGLRRSR